MTTPLPLNADHVEWCRRLFDSLAPNAAWGIPRSGLIFEKRGPKSLVLVRKMPYDEALPMSREAFLAKQLEDLEDTTTHFSMIGVEVTDATA